jgi:propanol-preferring alcohol dehydrogenase
MKAATIVAYREPMEIGDVPEPKVGPKEALVRVEASGMCRTDWHEWNGDWEWVGFKIPPPVIPGHEFGGTVTEVGSEVERIKVGDRVTIPFCEGCGTCESCLAGRSELCLNINFPGFTHSGGYGEYVAVVNADFNCITIPETVPMLATAGLGCRFNTAYNGLVLRGGLQPGEWVTVYGAGGLGLCGVHIASRLGARVIAIDIRDEALDLARQQGAVATLNSKGTDDVPAAVQEITKGGAHLSFDCWARHGTPLQSILGLRRAGRHVQGALTSQDDQGMVALPIDYILALELTYTGCMSTPHARYPELINLVESGHFDPTTLVTKEINVSEVNESMQALDGLNTLGMHVITSF